MYGVYNISELGTWHHYQRMTRSVILSAGGNFAANFSARYRDDGESVTLESFFVSDHVEYAASR